ncbi:AAA family ATPase [Geomonas sp. RF6]|uniref:AAA family ATPase n=1 Tax=Geomonas sp. RF6 TaxID=2897342 RepID=UPI001E45BE73|nr:AAA family ATPase [Geomonas sp. RF6]UFS69428.1 AAA family ATPase [Geomonas sp. RF6]
MKQASAVIMIGIPASGKSTFYKSFLFDSHVRINRDMLRTRHREKLLLEACLAGRQSYVVDNTNLTRIGRARHIGMAKEAGFRVIGYYFRSKVDESMERNRLRQGSARVPDQAIFGLAARLERPSLNEGFDELWYVYLNESGGFLVEKWQENG